MEAIKYKTNIKGNTVFLPDDILQRIDLNAEVEITVRSMSITEKSPETIDEILEKVTKIVNQKYPNINLKIDNKLKHVAGISSDIDEKWKKFSDKEIAGMERMKKHMEKGEILEALY